MPGLQYLDFTANGTPGGVGPRGPGVINWLGAYDNVTAYEANDAVSYLGSSYIALGDTTGNLPTDTDFWDLLAEKGDDGIIGSDGDDGISLVWQGPYDNGTAYVINDAVSYLGSSYICTAPTTGNLPTDAGFWDLIAAKGDTGATGDQGDQGDQGDPGDRGDPGGAITIMYTFDDTEADSDPGSGKLRLDDATNQNTATVIRADHLDAEATDWSSVLTTLDDSTSTNKGQIRLVNPLDQSKWLLFTVTAVGAESGYKNIAVTNVGSSGTAPFANADPIMLTFTRTGDKGDTGAAGGDGNDGTSFTWQGAYDNGTMYAVNDVVEYLGSSYIAIDATIGNLPTDVSFWELVAAKGDTGATGGDGADGIVGAQGGAISIEYTFDDTTTDSDPGSGLLRLSNATQNAATVIRADHLDFYGEDWSAVLPMLDDSTSTNKGQIRLFKNDDQSKWLLFSVSAVGAESGYKNITVSNVGSSDTNPFANGDHLVLAFTRTGDKGDTGATGDTGDTGATGDDGLSINWMGAYDNGTMYAINDAVSYLGSSYIATASTVGNLPTDTDFWDLMAQKGEDGEDGETGADGSNGQHGGGITAEWEFDSTTTDSDPGAGKLRLSNATQNAATVLRYDHLDFAGTDWSAILPTLDDSTSTIKGQIRLVHKTDQAKWLVFTVSAVGAESGYKNVTVSNIGSSTSSPFTNGDRLVSTFTRNGDKGDTGSTGSTGAMGQAGGAITIPYVFDTTTTDSDPGSGKLRLSNATQNASTVIRADLADSGGSTWTSVLDVLDDSTSTIKGQIRLVHATDQTKWLLFTLSAVGSETGYRNLTVANVSGSTSSPFSNADPILLTFTQTGDKGTTGTTGSAGTNGTNGLFGGAVAIEYTFDTTTTDSDPGSGKLRLSNATQNTATVIRADLVDFFGTTQTAVIDTFDDSTSTIKGHIRLVKVDDASKWLLFTVSSLASPSGYKNITVVNVSASTASPFSNGDNLILEFTRIGDKGDTGLTGSTGSAGADGTSAGVWSMKTTYDSSGTNPPSNGRLSIDGGGGFVYLDFDDTLGVSWADALTGLDITATDGITDGFLRIVKATDPTKWILYQVTDVSTPIGPTYTTFTVVELETSSGTTFSNGDALVVTFDVKSRSSHGFINTNTTFYVDPSGNDSTGDGSSLFPWLTATQAFNYLADYAIAQDTFVTISIAAGAHSWSGTTACNHPNGDRISILGSTPASKTLSSIQSTSGSAAAWSIILNLNSVSGIAVNDYVIIKAPTGGTSSTFLAGCHKVTNVDAVNTRITVLSKHRHATTVSGAVTGTVLVMKSIITVTGFSGFSLVQNHVLGSIGNLVLVGDGTTGEMAVSVNSGSYCQSNGTLGMVGFYNGLGISTGARWVGGFQSSGCTVSGAWLFDNCMMYCAATDYVISGVDGYGLRVSRHCEATMEQGIITGCNVGVLCDTHSTCDNYQTKFSGMAFNPVNAFVYSFITVEGAAYGLNGSDIANIAVDLLSTDGSFVRSIGTSDVILVLNADQVAANTQNTDANYLQLPVFAGECWVVELVGGIAGNDTTGDAAINLVTTGTWATSSAQNRGWHWSGATPPVVVARAPIAMTSTTNMVASPGLTVNNGDGVFRPFEFNFQFTAITSGTVKVQFGVVATTAGRTATLGRGTRMTCRRVKF